MRISQKHQGQALLRSTSRGLLSRLSGLTGEAVLLIVTLASVVAVGFIFWSILAEAAAFISDYSLTHALSSSAWHPTDPDQPEFGMRAILYGSLSVTVQAVLFAGPLGILVAIAMAEILPYRIRQMLKPVLELLASIPSVVFGFFALTVLTPMFQETFGMSSGTNAFTASLILALMALPTIVSVAEDSLQTVGRELREGAYALGATRYECVLKVVVPASFPGLCTAVLLGVMRAFGETMVVLMVAGNSPQIPEPFYNIFAPVRTMTATIAVEMGETPRGSLHYSALFFLAAMLLVVSLVINVLGEVIMRWQRKKLTGQR